MLTSPELLRSGNVGEREPRTRWLMTALGVITLGAGYYIAVKEEEDGGEEEGDDHADLHEDLDIHIAAGPAGCDVLYAGVVDQGTHDIHVLHQMLGMPVPFGFYISWSGMVQTAILFAGLLGVTLLLNLNKVRVSKPIELLRSGNVGEREPRTRWRSFTISAVPMYSDRVPESMTMTMVHRMQMLARPTAFCFIRYRCHHRHLHDRGRLHRRHRKDAGSGPR